MMSTFNLIDTFLNISVFTFIGILIWLYFKKESDADTNKAESQEPEGNEP